MRGNLIIIGGAEDKEGNKSILKEVCSKIDKEKDRLLIATVAADDPEATALKYTSVFRNLGVCNIDILNIKQRQDTTLQKNIDFVEGSSLIFFTGGDQLKITSLLGGTQILKSIKTKFQDGCTMVGTSAGASAMSDTMIVTGPSEEPPKKCTLKMAPGLGFLRGVIIDQHFEQRGRIGRLLVGISENPETLGIGLDEDTSIVVNENGKINVIGSGAVYVIDGSSITSTNVSEQKPDEILSIFDVKLHILKDGNMFNLKNRRPM
jgi:cyanophycinase